MSTLKDNPVDQKAWDLENSIPPRFWEDLKKYKQISPSIFNSRFRKKFKEEYKKVGQIFWDLENYHQEYYQSWRRFESYIVFELDHERAYEHYLKYIDKVQVQSQELLLKLSSILLSKKEYKLSCQVHEKYISYWINCPKEVISPLRWVALVEFLESYLRLIEECFDKGLEELNRCIFILEEASKLSVYWFKATLVEMLLAKDEHELLKRLNFYTQHEVQLKFLRKN